MSDHGQGFRARPRSASDERAANDEANARDELGAIRRRLSDRVIGTSRADFHDGSPSYDAASMALIRLAALLERPGAGTPPGGIDESERRAVAAMRSVVAHSGYGSMNDDAFWVTATTELPALVDRLLREGGSRG